MDRLSRYDNIYTKSEAQEKRKKGEYIYHVRGGWRIGTRNKGERVRHKREPGRPGIPVVYGDRICARCKGICHEDSYRENKKWKDRKRYYCSKMCIGHAFDEMNERFMRKRKVSRSMIEDIQNMPDYKKRRQEFIDSFEKVDVKTR